VFIVAMAGPAGLANCNSTRCTKGATFALAVTVVNASGKRVCDASVTVTDGALSAVLSPVGDSASCAYVGGPPRRQGTYSLEVRSRARNKKVDGLKFTADGCHVRQREVSVTLDQ
jgi:hypothetical protein